MREILIIHHMKDGQVMVIPLSEMLQYKQFQLNKMEQDLDHTQLDQYFEARCIVRWLRQCLDGKFDVVVVVEQERRER